MTDPKAGLRALLAGSSSFQTLVGADDAEEAGAFIHEFGRDAWSVPRAIIGHRGYRSESVATGSPDTWDRGGDLVIRLYLARPEESEWEGEDGDVWEELLGIVGDLEAASGVGSAMWLRGIEVGEVLRAKAREGQPHWRAEIICRWGNV
jgi:hypothetical protein